MNAGRLAAIAVIYVATAIAWAILSEVTDSRSRDTYGRLGYSEGGGQAGRASVQKLWGSAQIQRAPQAWTIHTEKQTQLNDKGKPVAKLVEKQDPVVLSSSRVKTDIQLDPRRKGLMWYSTYRVKFAGDYSVRNEFADKRRFFVRFAFPPGQSAYDNVLIEVKGKRVYPGADLTNGVVAPVELEPNEQAAIRVSYGSQGLDTWHYKLTDDEAVASVRDFEAVINTNCSDIDFPENCLSPTHKNYSEGWKLAWKYGDLISGSNVGISMPQRLQPGPFASRLSHFAPVSLLFFFAVLIILGTVKGIRLHPVNYIFLAATFFSFHLLFSYLVDHLAPFQSFLVASAVSLFLTISYLRLVVDWKFSIFQAGLWQSVFLVLFTYAFFFEGYTGLTITIGAIITLAVLMQVTGRVNWDEMLARQSPGKPQSGEGMAP